MKHLEAATERFVSFAKQLIHTVHTGNIPIDKFLAELLPSYYLNVDLLLDFFNQEAPSPITCGPNCGACCYSLANISPIETVNIIRYIRLNRTYEQRTQIKRALEHNATLLAEIQRTHANNLDELSKAYYAQQLPCVFQTMDENCSIHTIRPSICRNHHVVTAPDLCRDWEHIERVKIWRHPSLMALDVRFQTEFSRYYLGDASIDNMQKLLLQYWQFQL